MTAVMTWPGKQLNYQKFNNFNSMLKKKKKASLGDAMQVVSRFEHLREMKIIKVDAARRIIYVFDEALPEKKKARKNWLKNAYIYMAWKVGDKFEANSDKVILMDYDGNREIGRNIGGEVELK